MGGLVLLAAQFDMTLFREFLGISIQMCQDAVHGRGVSTHREVVGHVGCISGLYPIFGIISH